jgi:hypothetical protein
MRGVEGEEYRRPQGVAINAINTINQNPLKSLTNTPMFSDAVIHAVNH